MRDATKGPAAGKQVTFATSSPSKFPDLMNGIKVPDLMNGITLPPLLFFRKEPELQQSRQDAATIKKIGNKEEDARDATNTTMSSPRRAASSRSRRDPFAPFFFGGMKIKRKPRVEPRIIIVATTTSSGNIGTKNKDSSSRRNKKAAVVTSDSSTAAAVYKEGVSIPPAESPRPHYEQPSTDDPKETSGDDNEDGGKAQVSNATIVDASCCDAIEVKQILHHQHQETMKRIELMGSHCATSPEIVAGVLSKKMSDAAATMATASICKDVSKLIAHNTHEDDTLDGASTTTTNNNAGGQVDEETTKEQEESKKTEAVSSRQGILKVDGGKTESAEPKTTTTTKRSSKSARRNLTRNKENDMAKKKKKKKGAIYGTTIQVPSKRKNGKKSPSLLKTIIAQP